ncbi:hypothetical protein [Aliarcobacter thereius]|nr:hypothetical protein [Aliarcobacter thereius]
MKQKINLYCKDIKKSTKLNKILNSYSSSCSYEEIKKDMDI